ncbi:RsmB/NOP family class I SAM-dependent RNA methyltransferase [Roseobacter sp. YSTF-M11]|uniref:RsmB/NOP family class I SAM-dependent RNA methyltransferase n=1 Tax=Roseobacter insulae TaxID=2859783 RepID=A0A9X1FVN1_9RHOB|nr:RsmB/NOP family class I SAM-dependent RNA methyltransferase [Roseobacter insulae]MBW4708875.1 RsmB/NOP family class I SAM-dependent RNA methyltransferase [Roseobacter insulae]
MTPGARVAAAIDVLDVILAGAAAEQALTRWARGNRFAGSKDRAAIRDHVFDALRCKRSAAALGGAETGRAIMIGLLRQQGADLAALFSGQGHAPAPLDEAEREHGTPPLEKADLWNLPEWLVPAFEISLGPDASDAARSLQSRAPVSLRVNTRRMTRDAVITALANEGIHADPNPLSKTAVTVADGARRVRASRLFQDGLIELQDAASQEIVALLPEGGRCLDYCAGGGGKALAMAAAGRQVAAHDIDPRRMQDLPARARRAQATIDQIDTASLEATAPFDVVLCDAPCSGSGSWRRAPQAKWLLTPERLEHLIRLQDDILDQAIGLVTPKGWLVYATCSLLTSENEDRIAAFLDRHDDWICTFQRRFNVTDNGDGFFTAHLTRA